MSCAAGGRRRYLFAIRTVVQYVNNSCTVSSITRRTAGAQRVPACRVPLSKELNG
jgi:hypothetical protein